jgi:hypothetical protein
VFLEAETQARTLINRPADLGTLISQHASILHGPTIAASHAMTLLTLVILTSSYGQRYDFVMCLTLSVEQSRGMMYLPAISYP